jgi:hypothetical protein
MRTMPILVFLVACGGNGGGGDDDDDQPGDPDAARSDGGGNPGGGLFSDDLPWDRDVSGLDPSDDSDTIIGALDDAGGWGTGIFRIDFSIEVLSANASTPRVAFVPKDDEWAGDPDLAEFWRPDGDEVPVPLPEGGALEGETGYDCASDGDCHLIVVDQDSRELFEMWRADMDGGTLYGGANAVWDLDADYDPDRLRGRGCTSADAGGFPITAMLGTVEEVAAGEIPHALRFILPNERIRAGIYTPPGTHSTFPTDGGPDMPPYGVRLRLKDSFDESSLPSEGARVIARAMKRYGMFLADGGNLPLTLGSDQFADVTWEELDVDSFSLEDLAVTDFEVVELGELIDWDADSTCYREKI